MSRATRLMETLGPIGKHAAKPLIEKLALPPDLMERVKGVARVAWDGVLYVADVRHRRRGFEPFMLVVVLVDIEGNVIRCQYTCGCSNPNLVEAIRRITGWKEGKTYHFSKYQLD